MRPRNGTLSLLFLSSALRAGSLFLLEAGAKAGGVEKPERRLRIADLAALDPFERGGERQGRDLHELVALSPRVSSREAGRQKEVDPFVAEPRRRVRRGQKRQLRCGASGFFGQLSAGAGCPGPPPAAAAPRGF